MRNFKSDSVDRLFQAILLLENREECYRFFDDLCTIKEIQDMAQRLSTAEMIDKGVSYQKISDATGVSTATISRVSRCLNYGAGGYQEMLKKLKEEDKNE
ncbi:MAG: helix-turn-helix domain-containing protein [Ruminococcus sp.]|nr:helix-turn-helix domain-containing protein [Ruminococcus sp.]